MSAFEIGRRSALAMLRPGVVARAARRTTVTHDAAGC